jgi:hypothetical protein
MAYNPARGDVKIAHSEGEWVLRPSFAVIAALEAHFARSIFDIARDFAAGKLTRALDLKIFLQSGMEGGGQGVPENLEALMLAIGLGHLLEPVGRFLIRACGLGDE